jgi:hypothetical protein
MQRGMQVPVAAIGWLQFCRNTRRRDAAVRFQGSLRRARGPSRERGGYVKSGNWAGDENAAGSKGACCGVRAQAIERA